MSLLSRPLQVSGNHGEGEPGPLPARQVAEKLVRRIDPGPVWDVDQFVASVARRRRRPITVVESYDLVALSAGVTGQLWTRDRADEILLPPGLAPNERRYAIVHEMGHLLLDHPSRVSPDAWIAFFDALPPHLIRRRIAAFTCDMHIATGVGGSAAPVEMAEEEAEWFASLLLAEVDDKRARISARCGEGKTNQMIDRLARTFGYY